MFKKFGTTLKLTRGDTAYISVIPSLPLSNSERYVLETGDKLVFSLKKSTDIDTDVLIEKQFSADEDNNYFVKLESNETKLPYGEYIYDVQITFANGDINTIIEPAIFEITGEVSR